MYLSKKFIILVRAGGATMLELPVEVPTKFSTYRSIAVYMAVLLPKFTADEPLAESSSY
eukprot:SAG31_NODE_2174_length_6257_cov_1.750244_7_plen_59_part_00